MAGAPRARPTPASFGLVPMVFCRISSRLLDVPRTHGVALPCRFIKQHRCCSRRVQRSTPLAIGIRMRASALRSTSTGSPDPSLPTSNAEASHQSTSHGASSGCSPVSGSCTLEASMRNPATFSCVIRIGSGVPDNTDRCSAAPAEAATL